LFDAGVQKLMKGQLQEVRDSLLAIGFSNQVRAKGKEGEEEGES
jgi:hypothetical protein